MKRLSRILLVADQNVGNGYSKSWSQWKKETFGK